MHLITVTTDPEILPADDVVRRSDLLILCVPHRAYRNLDLREKPIVDIWDFYGPRAERLTDGAG